MSIVNLPNNQINFGNLVFYHGGQIGVSTRVYSKRAETYKRFVVLEKVTQEIRGSIRNKSHFMGMNYHKCGKVYVAPEVSLSRSIIRNSGYQIKRNPDDADYVVIPDVDDVRLGMFNYKIACYVNDELYLFYFRNECNLHGTFEEKIEKITKRLKEYFKEDNILFSYYDNSENGKDIIDSTCVLVPDIECFRWILEKSKNYKYISETRIPVEPTSQINVETLTVWRSIDRNILDKMICASNWQDYPFTLCTFLNAERATVNYCASSNLNMILRKIHFDDNYFWDDALITPKDFNMIQSYIWSRMGVPEDKATMVSASDLSGLCGTYRNLINKRVYVKPIELTQETTLKNIKTLLG